jgi:epoxyqueuosine reductase QueG
MPSKSDIISQAKTIGFADIGFTKIEPFLSHQQLLQERSWFDYAGSQINDCTSGQLLPRCIP